VVSLGHTDCTLAEARAAEAAGAACVTHLFNATSQLGSREPGLVGAALSSGLAAGLIADAVHVHPETIRLALAAKRAGPVFLVSDAMAVAGTDLASFTLGGRTIHRRDGRLTLADGTLAGADISLAGAVQVLIRTVGVAPETALAMATSVPADVIRAPAGRLSEGAPADLVLFGPDWSLARVWRGGEPVA
jgi:N-acetylglucosamine-6-phosphate deacetylase